MIQENILRFITEAKLGALQSVNKLLAEQAQALRNVAAASRTNAAGQRVDPNTKRFISAAEFQAAINNAANLQARVASMVSQIRGLTFNNLLRSLQAQLPKIGTAVGKGLQNIGAQIVRNISFAGLARAATEAGEQAARALATALGKGIPAAANAAAKVIRSSLVGAFRAAESAANAIRGAINRIGSAARRIAAGGGIIGGLGLFFGSKQAAEVDKNLAIINTIARTTRSVLTDIGTDLSRISAVTGTTIADLTSGFYDLLSAGIGVADVMKGDLGPSMEFIQAASNLAVGGLASVTEAVDLLTTVVNAFRGPLEKQFHDPILAATHAADIFAKTVELGKVKASELSATFSTAAPLAAQLGLSLEEMGAFIAVMTQQGFDAGEALTALRSAMIGIQRNSKALQKSLTDPIVKSELAKVGAKGWLEFLDVAGFQRFASVLRSYSERAGVPLIKLLGRIEGVQGILGVTGAQAANFADAFRQISDAEGSAAEQANLANDSLLAQLGLLHQAFAFLSFALFENSLIRPLTEIVKQFRFLVIEVSQFVAENQALFKAVVPIAAFLTAVLALTSGVDALAAVMIRIAPGLAGFSGGLGAISFIVGKIVLPIGLVALGFQLMSDAIKAGILPLREFVPLMATLDRLFENIAKFGGEVVETITGIVKALSTGDPVQLASFLSGQGLDLSRAADQITRSFHRAIDEVLDIVFGEFGTGIRTGVAGMGDVFIAAFKSLAAYLVPRLADTLRQVFQFGGEVFGNIVEFGARIGTAIVRGINDVLERLPDLIADIPELLSQAVSSKELNNVLSGIFAGLAVFVGGWFRPIAIALAIVSNEAAGEWAQSFIDTVKVEGPRMVDSLLDSLQALIDLALEQAPLIAAAITSFIGPVLETLGDFAGEIAPKLADATGALIDWIAKAIPLVAGAIARFVDEVVRNITGFGSDSGEVHNALSGAGEQLVKWITDRIPGAIHGLANMMGSLADWILTTGVPIILGALVGLGAALVDTLLDGIASAFKDPAQAATFIADALVILFSAAVIKGAIILAGSAAGLIWRAAFIAAGMAVDVLVGAIGSALSAVAATPAVAAAGAATGSAFASAATLAVPAAIAALIVGIGVGLAALIDRLVPGLAKQMSDNFFKGLGALGRLLFGDDSIDRTINFDIHTTSSGDFDLKDIAQSGDISGFDLKDIQANLRVSIDDFPGKLQDDLIGPLATAVDTANTTLEALDPRPFVQDLSGIQTEMDKTVEKFKTGSDDVVTSFNSIPDRLKSTSDLVKEALAKPFDLDGITKAFAENYQLILQAQSSGNVGAIVNANLLKTTMVEQANEINAAFIAAGLAPPFLVNAITGQITPATTAAKGMTNGIKTGLAPIPTLFTKAGQAAGKVAGGIKGMVPETALESTRLANAATSGLKNLGPTMYTAGRHVALSWVAGIVSTLNGKPVSQDIAEAAMNGLNGIIGRSPPTEGPLQEIDTFGENVGKAWVAGVIAGITGGKNAVMGAITTLSTDMGVVAAAVASSPINVAPAITGVIDAREGPTTLTTEDAEAASLLRMVVSALSLNNELTASGVRSRPRALDSVGGRGVVANAHAASSGRI